MLSILITAIALCLGDATACADDKNKNDCCEKQSACCAQAGCCAAQAHGQQAADGPNARVQVLSVPALRRLATQVDGAKLKLDALGSLHGNDHPAIYAWRLGNLQGQAAQQGDDGNKSYYTWARAAGGKGQPAAQNADDDDQKVPAVWIGVRMTPVPEPLASHIGKHGLMIANVAKGSPADEGGLERYDVVRSFNGQAIQELDDLMKAVGDAGEKKAQIVIVRGGKEQRIALKPAKRPGSGDMQYKYEDNDNVVDNAMQMRGHTLRKGPDGQWQLEDLGQLKDLYQLKNMPEAFKLFQDGKQWNFQLSPDDMKMFQFDPNQHQVIVTPGGAQNDAKFEIMIKVNDDGETIKIHRDTDGKLRVERANKDGKNSSKTYGDFKELEKDDADAAQTYLRYRGLGGGGTGWINVRPQLDQLPKMQKDWQQQIERHVKDAERVQKQAQEQAERAAKQAQEQAARALKQAERAREQAEKSARERMENRKQRRSADNDDREEKSESLHQSMKMKVDDDGRIELEMVRDGVTKRYAFKNKSEFKSREPELFKKVFGGD